jgi:hypothetical protein
LLPLVRPGFLFAGFSAPVVCTVLFFFGLPGFFGGSSGLEIRPSSCSGFHKNTKYVHFKKRYLKEKHPDVHQ